MMIRIVLVCLLFSLISITQASANELIGRVSDVLNGDTIIVTDVRNKKHKVYLLGIDAPEIKQPFGKKSRDYLEHLFLGRDPKVRIVIKKHTRAKNIVGTAYAAKINSTQYADINGMMVMAGYAWANPRTSRQYIAAEKIARNRRAGLWEQKSPVPPWQWRKKKK